jgi:hypothetical protein
MSRLAFILLHKETDPEKQWKLLCQVNKELSRLRRDDDRAKRTAMEQADQTHEILQPRQHTRQDEGGRPCPPAIPPARDGKTNLPALTIQPFNASTSVLPEITGLLHHPKPEILTNSLINEIWPELNSVKNPNKSPKIKPNKG